MQLCHNFKDPGVQVYGGALFKSLQIKADMVFCSLPPPVRGKKPGQVPPPISAAANEAIAAQPEAVMNEYIDSSNSGCFCGNGIVKMFDGTFKQVKDLLKGETIISSDGICAKVVCVVIFPIGKEIDLVNINGVGVTPKHPIKVDGVWKYPGEVLPANKSYCDCLYNLVLDKNHVANINNIDMITLGHKKHESSVLSHPYYGTERVIEDLKNLRGWNDGRVLMEGCKKFLDPFTGKVMCIQ